MAKRSRSVRRVTFRWTWESFVLGVSIRRSSPMLRSLRVQLLFGFLTVAYHNHSCKPRYCNYRMATKWTRPDRSEAIEQHCQDTERE